MGNLLHHNKIVAVEFGIMQAFYHNDNNSTSSNFLLVVVLNAFISA